MVISRDEARAKCVFYDGYDNDIIGVVVVVMIIIIIIMIMIIMIIMIMIMIITIIIIIIVYINISYCCSFIIIFYLISISFIIMVKRIHMRRDRVHKLHVSSTLHVRTPPSSFSLTSLRLISVRRFNSSSSPPFTTRNTNFLSTPAVRKKR